MEWLIIVVVLLLVLLFFLWHKGEDFDMNYNHDYAAARVYAQEEGEMAAEDSYLRREYLWKQKDAQGYNVYDKIYDNIVKKSVYAPQDAEYGEREIRRHAKDAQYDQKFSNLSDNRLATYDYSDMSDITPMSTTFNGQTITLAQKDDSMQERRHAIFKRGRK